jgi:hypothetical protein
MQASFESPAMEGYVAASAAIGAALGESAAAAAVRVTPTKALVAGGKSGSDHYAARLAQTYVKPAGGIRPSLSTAAIPAEYLGVTFTYDVDTDQYGPSELAGAPADGVRFIVYAVNAISGQVIEPLVEVGYADVVTTETITSETVRIELVSGGVTYLDYAVGATGSPSSSQITLTITGFVSNGDDRVNFDLDTHIDLSSTSFTLDYSLVVPTRGGFRMDFEGESANGSMTSTLEARGPHGTVGISGTQTSTTATFEVEVNGELFATITTTGSAEPVITGADGEALTEAELEALGEIFAVFLQGSFFFEDLFGPLS